MQSVLSHLSIADVLRIIPQVFLVLLKFSQSCLVFHLIFHTFSWFYESFSKVFRRIRLPRFSLHDWPLASLTQKMHYSFWQTNTARVRQFIDVSDVYFMLTVHFNPATVTQSGRPIELSSVGLSISVKILDLVPRCMYIWCTIQSLTIVPCSKIHPKSCPKFIDRDHIRKCHLYLYPS